MEWWHYVVIADTRAVLVARAVVIVMMLSAVYFARTREIKVAFGFYGVWKILEALSSPIDMMTIKLFSLYWIQAFMMYAIYVAIEHRISRERRLDGKAIV